jgi:uncharacterized SAM-binding protein YcdF (DUF218 family)
MKSELSMLEERTMKESIIEESGSHRGILLIKDSPSVIRKIRLFGIINRKERWGLSWKGWLMIGLLVVGLVTWSVDSVYRFLAVTDRVNTNALVVEGWVHEYAIRAAINEFNAGHYQRVFTTGGPIVGMGGYTNDYNTSASVGAGRLKTEGFSPDHIQMVPSRVSERDRTYNAGRALRNWFREHHTTVDGVNVVTEDVHARRTRLLFQKALGDGIKVGVIAAPNPDYDPKYWWRYSDGVREVIAESIAYTYARLFFWPPRER